MTPPCGKEQVEDERIALIQYEQLLYPSPLTIISIVTKKSIALCNQFPPLCKCINNNKMKIILSAFLLAYGINVNAFTSPLPRRSITLKSTVDTSSSALQMSWWFGGTPSASEISSTGEECELVAVRIEKTSANSRRIAGEIVVDAPLMDVWAILTDYDNLSTHVPNLVASKRISGAPTGNAGDGSYKCRLYQRGAQKIIGFEFGADVTMDMSESIVVAGKAGPITQSHELDAKLSSSPVSKSSMFPEERRINFKCVDSQFFSEFDGTWRVVQMPDNPYTGEAETTVSYTVDVRPKGPVPVAALEWRIREDVPTNLRAVKRAAMDVGMNGVMENKHSSANTQSSANGNDQGGFADFILDYENETLGAYLE